MSSTRSSIAWPSDAHYVRASRGIAAWNAVNPIIKRGLALTPVKFGISFTSTMFNQAGALVHRL
jgi:xanthine dehydrogenase large subunit